MMNFLNKLFSKNNLSEKTENQIITDFDSLVAIARKSGEIDDLYKLYRKLLELNNWIFITPNNQKIENSKPFIGVVDENSWVFIFTDSKNANDYCKQFEGFIREDRTAFLIKMKVKDSIEMLYQLSERGVFGIRINEGENGWFCSISDLPNIINHLKVNIE